MQKPNSTVLRAGEGDLSLNPALKMKKSSDEVVKMTVLSKTVKTVQWLTLAGCLAAWSLSAAESPKPTVPAKKRAIAKGFKDVGVDEFDRLRADKQNRVLDVRTAREFATGHMPGAINIDINAPEFEQKVGALDKTKTYLVHCAGGLRSAKACSKMSQLQFTNLYNLEGGFRAWETAGKAVEK